MNGVDAERALEPLVEALNVVLVAGDWEQVAQLSLSLYARAVAVGEMQLAELVRDIRSIALDAVAYPSGDDGVIAGLVDHGISV